MTELLKRPDGTIIPQETYAPGADESPEQAVTPAVQPEPPAKVGEVISKSVSEDLVAFSGEVVIVGSDWSDSKGYTTKFEMHELDGGHPLKKYNKASRFLMVLVEIADDEQPIDQRRRRALEEELAGAGKGGKWSNDAGMLSKARDFHRYLVYQSKIGRHWDQETRDSMARQYILDTLRIKSRRDIDLVPGKATEYQNLISQPYYSWLRDHQDKPKEVSK